MSIEIELNTRAANHCELCAGTAGLAAFAVSHGPDDADGAVLLCSDCTEGIDAEGTLEDNRWFCLRESAWSAVAPVQVLSWRLLHRIPAPWATDLRDQIWMDDDTRAWAEAGLAAADDGAPKVIDSNGATLQDGDAVTLIKDLAVKGAGFTAKRGTLVKNIRIIDDPTHVEGRVNGTAIYLKTEFLKRVTG